MCSVGYSRMQFPKTLDTTSLDYWLNWRVFLCATWVLGSMAVGLYLIWKYERSDCSESCYGDRTEEESLRMSSYVKAWKPCLKGIHPVVLLVFRIVAFCLLFVAISFDVVAHGFELYYYYTQWTFTIVTLYFALASLFSIHGCLYQHKINSTSNLHLSKYTEEGYYMPLEPGINGIGLEKINHSVKSHLEFCGDLLQIFFQMTAGAVAITDIVYWCVMYPFLNIKDYQMNFLTVVAHSLNAVMLLGDTALNSLQFPMFRIGYFLVLTSIYVLFQWIVHATVLIWWPYPFLELSADYSPLWYLVVALLHVPSYGVFRMVVKAKHRLFSKCFPDSYCYAHGIVS